MTIALEMPNETIQFLEENATQHNFSPLEYTQWLFNCAIQREKNRTVIAILDAFMEEDGQEQKETWEALKKGLEESRCLSRK